MFSAFQTFGRLGAGARAVSAAWTPLALWPDGIASPGMWISPRDLTSQWAEYTGTTPVSVPGTVADSANPVGLALDIRAGATALTDPGNHMLQSTSAARPLASARVNYFTQTSDVSNAAWAKSGSTTPSADTVLTPAANAYIYESIAGFAGKTVTLSMKVSGTGTASLVSFDNVAEFRFSPVTLSPTPTRRTFTVTFGVGAADIRAGIGRFNADSATSITVTELQVEYGSAFTTYQRVNTASDYDATGFPVAQLYDGVDDSMATAAFSAGTLINGMDCMIAVRRDSAAATYLISDTGSRGFFEWESGDTSRPDVSAGTPTYYVDGVAVTATKGALFTALTAGDWHILEARGLDLSTWTKVEVSSLVSYRLNGPRGDIMLFPSTASTEDKDAARQWLADYYGVTLP